MNIFETIDEFEGLENNWDGYGGTPLINSIAVTAKRIISEMPGDVVAQISDVFPNPTGTLSIEWNNREWKCSLELGVSGYSYFITKGGNPILSNDGDIAHLRIKQIVKQLRKLLSVEQEDNGAVTAIPDVV